MRCRDVKRHLNDAGELDPEILSHLKKCKPCAREFDAAQALDTAFEAVRDKSAPEATPFAELRTKLETLSSHKKIEEEPFMARLRTKITNHPKFSFGLVTAVCLFAFVLLVPISYQKTIGYTLALEGTDGVNRIDDHTAREVINALGYGDIQISIESEGKKVKCIIENLPSQEAVHEIVSVIPSLTGIPFQVAVSPVVIREMGSIYGQVRDKIGELKLDTKGKSDQEVKVELEKILIEGGHPNPQVEVITNSDGYREIRVDTKVSVKIDKRITEKQEKKVLIIGKEDTVKFEPYSYDTLDIDMEGKTNEQIEVEIRDSLFQKGVENPEITIKELLDGRREVKVEVKEEKKIDEDN